MATFPSDLNVGFIGSGKMAEALVAGFIKSGLLKPEKILMSNRTQPRLDVMSKKYGVRVTLSNEDVMKAGGLVFLAIKPHILPDVVRQLARLELLERTVLVSVAAGLTLQSLSEFAGDGVTRIIRVMPNTPSLVGAGASCYSGNASATQKDLEHVHMLLESVGLTQLVPETQIDAMSGLMGSGPAYMFMAIEAMSDGGVKMGIPRDQAIKFAAQTMLGAAKMVLDTGLHPGTLKDNVCSPGGSTIAAVHELEKAGFRAALISAVQASTLRGKELGKQ